MPVKDVKLYVCDGCQKHILIPRNGVTFVSRYSPKWVGGFPEHGAPEKGATPIYKPPTPKGDGPFAGITENPYGSSGDGLKEVTLCRKCLATRFGFTPDNEEPEPPTEPLKPPVTRFGHDDPV